MRVLVTGGAGFLGSHLCEKLLEDNLDVICMDNLITGSISNISHIRSDKFLFIKHDVTNYIYIDGPLDYIFHFASPASPIDYLEYPIQTLKVGLFADSTFTSMYGISLALKGRTLYIRPNMKSRKSTMVKRCEKYRYPGMNERKNRKTIII